MANSQHPGFLVLPPEMRFEVYRHLIMTALAEGVATDIGGLYVSCHTVQAEMETLIVKVQPIFDIKHTWDMDHRTGDECILRFELPLDYNYTASLTDLRFCIPVPHGPIPYCQLAHTLTPVLQLPLATLRVAIYNPDPNRGCGFLRGLKALEYALICQSSQTTNLPQTNRIILQHGWGKAPITARIATDSIGSTIFLLRSVRTMANLKALTGSKEEIDGRAYWTLALDFEAGLPAPRGETPFTKIW